MRNVQDYHATGDAKFHMPAQRAKRKILATPLVLGYLRKVTFVRIFKKRMVETMFYLGRKIEEKNIQYKMLPAEGKLNVILIKKIVSSI